MLGAKPHHRSHFLSRARQNHDPGQMPFERIGVTFVNEQFLRFGNDPIGSDNGTQFRQKVQRSVEALVHKLILLISARHADR